MQYVSIIVVLCAKICRLHKKDNTPADIRLRENQARFLLLEGKVEQSQLSDHVFMVDDSSSQTKR